MTPRDNILGLLRRQGYTRAPVSFSLCPSLEEIFHQHAGSKVDYTAYYDFPFQWVSDYDLPGRANLDWSRYYPDGSKKGTVIDLWGIAHEPGSAEARHMTRMLHPLQGVDSLQQMMEYPFPDFAAFDYAGLAATVRDAHARGYAVMAGMACTIWETSWYLRSMEDLMMDMAGEDDKAVFLLDTVTAIACQRATGFARAGVDAFHFGDDIGMQSSLMMSLDYYRAWIKPRLARVCAAVKAVNPDAIITYHSCGYVTPAIDDLIEAGVEVLNPVQPECMDFAEIHAQFGDRLSFWGTIGTQTTMPFGTPEDVRAAVFRNLEIAGDRGGLFCTPTHMLEPEVPWENIEAYVTACRDFAGTGAAG